MAVINDLLSKNAYRLMGYACVAFILTLGGCADDSTSSPEADGDISTSDASDDAGSNDVSEEQDGQNKPDTDSPLPDGTSGDAEVKPTASLDFWFLAESGEIGQGSDEIELSVNDELAAYNEEPGFQTTLQVRTEGISNGSVVFLVIDENASGASSIAVEEGEEFGTARFENVNLEEGEHQIQVYVDGEVTVEKTVTVLTGACAVALLATNDACIREDADPETPGFQVTFEVENTDGNCTDAFVTVLNGPEGDVSSDPTPMADNRASITVTLTEEESVDDVVISVTAGVSNQDDLTLTATTDASDFTVDSAAPVIAISQPGTNVLFADNDEDTDADGFQLTIAGTATGLPIDGVDGLELLVDDVTTGVTSIDPDGNYNFGVITIPADGNYVLTVRGEDACGNTGEATAEILVTTVPANFTFLVPDQAAQNGPFVMLAKDDADPETANAYETTFSLFVAPVFADSVLSVECRTDELNSVFLSVGSLDITDDNLSENGSYDVAVQIDVDAFGSNTLLCQGTYTGPTIEQTVEIPIQIALPAPSLAILDPETGTALNSGNLSVNISASGLAGVEATVSLENSEGAVAISSSVTTIEDGLNAFTITSAEGEDIADGSYTLTVDAQDALGNVASDIASNITSVNFDVDSSVPEVSITGPSGTLTFGDGESGADTDPATPGFQTTVTAFVSDQGVPPTEACLTVVPGASESCVAIDPEGAATFNNVTLQPGSNALTVTATDLAGNEGSAAADIALEASFPAVVVTSPLDGSVVAQENIDVQANITDGVGTPITPASVLLQLNGENTDIAGVSSEIGTYTFPGVTLQAGANTLMVIAADGGDAGASGLVNVTYKTEAPTVAFTSPAADVTFNTQAEECVANVDDCITTISAAISDGDGAAATLTVTCSGNATSYVSEVADGNVSWDLTLPDQNTCSLVAYVEDEAGLNATAGPLSVTIDRVAPVIIAIPSPADDLLQFYNDDNTSAPGMQKTISVEVSGVEAGQTVDINVNNEAGDLLFSKSVLVSSPVGDTDSIVISGGQFDLPDGTILINASTTDAAGNVSNIFGRVLLVISEEALVSLLTPLYFTPQTCSSNAGCPSGTVCYEGDCVTAWSSATSKQILMETSGVLSGSDNIRVCTDNPAEGAAPCATGGYGVLFTQDLISSSATLNINAIEDGVHTLMLEALTTEQGGDWITSLDNANVEYRSRTIYVDTVAPSVTNLAWTTDTIEPFDVLNIAEQTGPKTYPLEATANESGETTIYIDGVEQTTVISNDENGVGVNDVTFLTDGSHIINAVVKDAVGNSSTLALSPTLTVTVWTEAPELQFTSPSSTPLLQGSSLDISLISDENASVEIFDSGNPLFNTVVDATGQVTVVGALTEGAHTLTATATDFAGNVSTAATSPANIFVDTIPATVNLIAPADSTLTDEDDAAPGQGGFQTVVNFEHGDAASWRALVATNCDDQFNNCGSAVEKASGTIVDGGSVAPFEITLPYSLTGNMVVSVEVTDSTGNKSSDSADVSLVLDDCVLVFNGLPGDGVFNAEDCDAPGCLSVTKSLSVILGGACGDVESIQLLQDGAPLDEVTLADSLSGDFTITLNSGDSFTLEAVGLDGATSVASTGAIDIVADFELPVVSFISEEVEGFTTANSGDSVTYGVDADQNSAIAGLQFHVSVTASDANGGLAGGNLVSITATPTNGGNGSIIDGGVLPQEINGANFAQELKFLTLGDQNSWTIEAIVEDKAGNQASTSFTALVDLLPPAEVILTAFNTADINTRLPSFPLSWSSPASNSDGTGDATVSYDIRYSRLPIITQANFDTACSAASIPGATAAPTPGEVGGSESYEISGPDARPDDVLENGSLCKLAPSLDGSPYYFAVQATDAAGNKSAITGAGSTSSDAASLQFAKWTPAIGDGGDEFYEKYVVGVGDLNGDELDDAVLGGKQSHGFCVVYGHELNDGGFMEDLTLTGASGPHHTCISQPDSGLGSDIAAGGADVNGDGYDDIVATAGFSTTGYEEEVQVFLGGPDGISTTPALSITGTDMGFLYGPEVDAGGNFNGDVNPVTGFPVGDIIVASRNEDRAYIIPGASSGVWPAASLDLTDDVARSTFDVVSLTMVDGEAGNGTQFAYRVAFVGDVLENAPGNTFDEVAVTQTKDPENQVVVLQGRANAGGGEDILINLDITGSEAGNSQTVRLKADSTQTNFGKEILGGQDLDGDGVTDIIVNHDKDEKIYFFSGALINDSLGGVHQVNADSGSAYGDNVLEGTNGTVITQKVANIGMIGNFDQDPDGTIDFVYGISSFFDWGSVTIRANQSADLVNNVLGTMPFEDIVLSDVVEMEPATAFGARIAPLGDFNGDGKPDILIGSGGGGSAVLVY